MTWLAAFMSVMALVAAYLTSELSRMRRESQRMLQELQAKNAEADRYIAEARAIYADASARWLSIVTSERRVH